MLGAPSIAAGRPRTVSLLALLGGFLLLGVLAAWGAPQFDHTLNPTATQPGVISYLGVGLPVLGLTAFLLFYGLRSLLPRSGVFLAAAFGYNALLIAVKVGLGPSGIYALNARYIQQALPPGVSGYNPGFYFLAGNLTYPGLAAITAILYAGAFFLLYAMFQLRLQRRLGIPVRYERRFLQLLVVMFILAAVGGMTVVGLLGFFEYAFSFLYLGAIGLLVAIALIAAIFLCSVAFNEAAEHAELTRNVTALSTFAWVGLAFIAAYHVLWLVFLLTLISIWPLRPWSYVGGGAK